MFIDFVQSQPCHWRNIKSVAKRDLSNNTFEIDTTTKTQSSALNTDPTPATTDNKDGALSDNISLFQSLRVLQEGEEEGEEREAAIVHSKIFVSLFRLIY